MSIEGPTFKNQGNGITREGFACDSLPVASILTAGGLIEAATPLGSSLAIESTCAIKQKHEPARGSCEELLAHHRNIMKQHNLVCF